MNVRVVCGGCGHVLVESADAYPSDLGDCPVCGSPLKQVQIVMEDSLTIREEIEVTATNAQGDITAERISRTDGNTSSELAADLGQPADIRSSRNRRIEGFDEEGIVAEELVKARNAKRGTRYAVQAKPVEDSDYADRVLVSDVDDPGQIDVQIRHLDDEVIARISPKKGSNDPGEFKGKREPSDLEASINKAITRKAVVDAATKARAILLLQNQAPLGKLARKQLQRMSFDLKGFKEIWVAPFREECFQLFPPLSDGEIAPVAYKLWKKAGRPWGDEQRFWYAAIDEIRGI